MTYNVCAKYSTSRVNITDARLFTRVCCEQHFTSQPPLSSLPLFDGQAQAWPFSVFTPKQVFGPRTDKSHPIWIKFCIHLFLYGIHLWTDLDRDRRVGGSRPNQNGYVFVILVTHPKSYIETTDRCDFGGKPSKWR